MSRSVAFAKALEVPVNFYASKVSVFLKVESYLSAALIFK